MNRSNAEKIFHHLHHCTNLMHRAPCGGHGRGNGHTHGRGGHRGQGRIIALLQERDGIGQRELAELLHIRPPSLSELLDKLESNGMIERRQSESDRRMSHVFLTKTGRESASQFEAAR
ncbi:MAG: MarR family transcriptional regulator [Oxalobacter sp.]|nr:MarR family transcriptional regulator [Oxalobacter sp.]